eukprot:gnl/MRDRNA2_/MRDRNA2_85643_c0_seq2.p1 gnl/MRDRNA2_/MRDRNA2_85643_c0~~gnl/MRDRNA2_/MRDRNA2_85643_c0_seq2.p1  ORF type:complete len:146 (-),score=23.27 gnl/MRDRNA2_/MRDRNA2_85643_c0_seq2:278-715(-)
MRVESSGPLPREALLEEISDELYHCDAQAMGNVYQVSVALGLRGHNPMGPPGIEGIAALSNFNTQNIANIAWSFARLCMADQEAIRIISAEIAVCIHHCISQNISNLVQLCRTSGFRGKVLSMSSFRPEACFLDSSSAQDLGNTI